MADSQLILELLFLQRRGGCSLTVLLFFLMLVGTFYSSMVLFGAKIFITSTALLLSLLSFSFFAFAAFSCFLLAALAFSDPSMSILKNF